MNFNNINVLLVEDDPNVRMCLIAMLDEMGISQIHAAENGLEAINLIDELLVKEEKEIDLIICDWNMPHKTGIEFLREVRQVTPDLPFLMITARADENSVQTAAENNVTSYIRKPFTQNHLTSKLSNALNAIQIGV